MGFRIRKRFRITKGVYINLSKGGVSATVGGKGVTMNSRKRGVRVTKRIPGVGISLTQQLFGGGKKKRK